MKKTKPLRNLRRSSRFEKSYRLPSWKFPVTPWLQSSHQRFGFAAELLIFVPVQWSQINSSTLTSYARFFMHCFACWRIKNCCSPLMRHNTLKIFLKAIAHTPPHHRLPKIIPQKDLSDSPGVTNLGRFTPRVSSQPHRDLRSRCVLNDLIHLLCIRSHGDSAAAVLKQQWQTKESSSSELHSSKCLSVSGDKRAYPACFVHAAGACERIWQFWCPYLVEFDFIWLEFQRIWRVSVSDQNCWFHIHVISVLILKRSYWKTYQGDCFPPNIINP